MRKLFILVVLGLALGGSAFAQTFETGNTVGTPPTINPAEQGAFKIADRKQRVRFFLSGKMSDSAPQAQIQATDPAKQRVNWSYFGAIANPPRDLGLSEFSEKSIYFGFIANPGLLTCATDLLKLVKQVGDANLDVFARWQIDEINLFLKPAIRASANKEYKLHITPVANIPNDPALNVQIPIVFEREETICLLPTAIDFERALKDAASR